MHAPLRAPAPAPAPAPPPLPRGTAAALLAALAVVYALVVAALARAPALSAAPPPLQTLRRESGAFPRLRLAPLRPAPDDVSLLVQLSFDRFDALVLMAARWRGPMSIALFVRERQRRTLDLLLRRLDAALAASAAAEPPSVRVGIDTLRRHADVHVYFERDASARYPVNRLRNLALGNAATRFVVTLDADFEPSADLLDALRAARPLLDAERTALVIAAFELDAATSDCARLGERRAVDATRLGSDERFFMDELVVGGAASARHGGSALFGGDVVVDDAAAAEARCGDGRGVPYDARELVAMRAAAEGSVRQVHLIKGVHAHGPTNYSEWYRRAAAVAAGAPAPRGAAAVETYAATFDYLWEPYVMLARDDALPRYDERFIGYGNDKVSHLYELAAAGYAFRVLPSVFVVHRDHGEPAWRSDQGSGESWQRWADFCRDVAARYNGWRLAVPQWLRDDCARGDCPPFWDM